MNGSAVFLITFFTSAVTSVGTVYLVERLQLFDAPSKDTVSVPALTGLDEAQARSQAANLGLVFLIEGRKADPDAETGTVLRQTLPAGQVVPRGQSIAVTIAQAIPKVPNVVGMPAQAAKERLREAGYEVREEERTDESAEEGQVVEQEPAAKSALLEGEVVLIQVSGGAEIEVPRVVGLSYSKAKEKLAEVGLETNVRWVDMAETWTGVVLSQKPEEKQEVERGSSVEIVINRE